MDDFSHASIVSLRRYFSRSLLVDHRPATRRWVNDIARNEKTRGTFLKIVGAVDKRQVHAPFASLRSTSMIESMPIVSIQQYSSRF